jgi:aldose 1-epimerase
VASTIAVALRSEHEPAPASRVTQALREGGQRLRAGSGRELRVSTTETGLQFYSGNFLSGVQGRGEQPYIHDGFCLEAQSYPDQVNTPLREAVILRPGRCIGRPRCIAWA